MNKKLTYAGLAALLLVVISGCGEKPSAAEVGNENQDSSTVVSAAGGNADHNSNAGDQSAVSTPQPSASSAPPAATEQPAEPEKQSRSIAVYYTDPQQMDLVAAQADVSYADDVEKYKETYKALQSSENKEQVPLWGKIELKTLEFAEGQLQMDIHKPEEAQLGAGGESMAISALTQTFFQFEEIKSIELLVDGEKAESLMGHVDLEHPMTRENSGL